MPKPKLLPGQRTRSLQKLKSIHPLLKATVETAMTITSVPFDIEAGRISVEEYQKLRVYGLPSGIGDALLDGKACCLVPFVLRKKFYFYQGYLYIHRAVLAASLKTHASILWLGSHQFVNTVYYDPSVFVLDDNLSKELKGA